MVRLLFPGFVVFLCALRAGATCETKLVNGRTTAVFPQKPVVVLVDVASSGVDLVPLFAQKGYSVVHATSGLDPIFVSAGSKKEFRFFEP